MIIVHTIKMRSHRFQNTPPHCFHNTSHRFQNNPKPTRQIKSSVIIVHTTNTCCHRFQNTSPSLLTHLLIANDKHKEIFIHTPCSSAVAQAGGVKKPFLPFLNDNFFELNFQSFHWDPLSGSGSRTAIIQGPQTKLSYWNTRFWTLVCGPDLSIIGHSSQSPKGNISPKLKNGNVHKSNCATAVSRLPTPL